MQLASLQPVGRLNLFCLKLFDICSTSLNLTLIEVLVEGSPGIGKTTFCLKIAYDWANDKQEDWCLCENTISSGSVQNIN